MRGAVVRLQHARRPGARGHAARARERALELGRPVCFDPNLRLERWPSRRGRRSPAARACLPGCLLVKANAAEARLLTGEDDPAAAAEALAAGASTLVVVTLGPDGALARGAQSLRGPGRAARVDLHRRRRRRVPRDAARAPAGDGLGRRGRPGCATRWPTRRRPARARRSRGARWRERPTARGSGGSATGCARSTGSRRRRRTGRGSTS